MFGIGMSEAIVILAIAIIVIDPKKIPDIAKFIGRILGEFKNATQDLKKSFNVDEYRARFKTYDDIKDLAESAIDITPEPPEPYDEGRSNLAAEIGTEPPKKHTDRPPDINDE